MPPKPERSTNRYSTSVNSPDIASTYLALDAIAKFPQIRYGSIEIMIQHLLENMGKPDTLTLEQFASAKVDEELAWETARMVHKTYRVGTNKRHYRDPENQDSSAIFPKSKEWLGKFVKSFINQTVDTIRDRLLDQLYGEDLYTYLADGSIQLRETNPTIQAKVVSVSDIQNMLQKQPELRQAILTAIQPTLDEVEATAKARREAFKKESEEKYGQDGVKYD